MPKIIVTTSEMPIREQVEYEATKWVTRPDNLLEVYSGTTLVAAHAPGTWVHVRGYAEGK